MKLVPFRTNNLTSDKHFMVDDEDYERVTKYGWSLGSNSAKGAKTKQYMVRRHATPEEREAGSPTMISLHRFIMNVHLKYGDYNDEVDHKNRNQIDNRKENLRVVNKQINQRNKRTGTNMGEGLWGATFNKAINNIARKWQANFHIKGKTYMCGFFDSEIEAHNSAVAKYVEITGLKPRCLSQS